MEVNRATEDTFGYTADEMVGRELAELIIPPHLREPHRRGVERYVATGQGRMVGHPVELPAMRKDGSEFPVEIAITPPAGPGPADVHGLPARRDRAPARRGALRILAEEQAALRRVATAVAREAEPARVFAVVTEEVGRLLGAQTSNMIRYEPDGGGLVAGGWSTGGARNMPVGTRWRSTARPWPRGSATAPARARRRLRGEPGSTAELVRDLGFRSTRRRPDPFGGRCGAP